MNMAHIMQTSAQPDKMLKTLNLRRKAKMMISFRCKHPFIGLWHNSLANYFESKI